MHPALVVSTFNSPEFVDLAPLRVNAKLLGAGIYLESVYWVLGENQEVKERRKLAKDPLRAILELVATVPGKVLSWDIAKNAGSAKGKYIDRYLMIDIHSRLIVGAHVHAIEPAILAVEMMREIFVIHSIPQVPQVPRADDVARR